MHYVCIATVFTVVYLTTCSARILAREGAYKEHLAVPELTDCNSTDAALWRVTRLLLVL